MVPLAVTEDEAAARRWLAGLEAATIRARVRIEDTRRMGTGSSMLPMGPVFATALYVPEDRRFEAARVLIDLGWDGRQVGNVVAGIHRRGVPLSTMMGGALAALVGALAVAFSAVLQSW